VPLEIEEISNGMGEKLMIHQDAVDKIPIHKDSGDKLMIRPDPVDKMTIHKDRVAKLVIHQDSSAKLPIHKDSVQYDENGRAIEQSRAPRSSKKKKTMEVNETQISKSINTIATMG
jgi:checkpoint serine/threonine-protein kinase